MMEACIRLGSRNLVRQITTQICGNCLRRVHLASVSSAASERKVDGSLRQRFRRNPMQRSCLEDVVHRFSSSSLYTPPEEGESVPFVLKPELEFDAILRERGRFEESVKARNLDGIDINKMVELWEAVCKLEEEKLEMEKDRKVLNTRAKQLSKQKGDKKEEREALQQRGRGIREALKQVNSSLNDLMNKLYPLALSLPNQLHSEVPLGDENKVIDTFGDQPTRMSGTVESHSCISSDHRLVHPGYGYMTSDLVLREMDLIANVSQQLSSQGFTQFSMPDMFKPLALEALGITPENSPETYAIETSENTMHLAGTSPMGFLAYYMMTVVEADDLPQRSFAVGRHYNASEESSEFQGLHCQFQDARVELFGVCEGSDKASNALFQQYIQTLRASFSEFDLPFRLVEVSSTRLLPSVHRMNAIEVWLPSEGRYVEVANVCSSTDYISRRLKVRYPSNPFESAAQSRERKFVHTIHGTALKTSVLLSALLEHEAPVSQAGHS